MISTLGLTCNVGWFEKLNVAEVFLCNSAAKNFPLDGKWDGGIAV